MPLCTALQLLPRHPRNHEVMMYFQTTVRFISAIVGALAAFYLGAHLFHALGYVSDQELEHVGGMYARLLSPITSLDWVTQRTTLVVVVMLLLQALLVTTLFHRWSYRPIAKLNPLARQITTGGEEACGTRIP